jgi:hypothetical protein
MFFFLAKVTLFFRELHSTTQMLATHTHPYEHGLSTRQIWRFPKSSLVPRCRRNTDKSWKNPRKRCEQQDLSSDG